MRAVVCRLACGSPQVDGPPGAADLNPGRGPGRSTAPGIPAGVSRSVVVEPGTPVEDDRGDKAQAEGDQGDGAHATRSRRAMAASPAVAIDSSPSMTSIRSARYWISIESVFRCEASRER